MKNKEFAWITEMAEKLQSPLVYNERQRLTKIAVKALPAILKALDESATTGYSQHRVFDDGTEGMVATGESCNGCGQDYDYEKPGLRHWRGTGRDGIDTRNCEIEDLHKFLAELEEKSAK